MPAKEGKQKARRDRRRARELAEAGVDADADASDDRRDLDERGAAQHRTSFYDPRVHGPIPPELLQQSQSSQESLIKDMEALRKRMASSLRDFMYGLPKGVQLGLTTSIQNYGQLTNYVNVIQAWLMDRVAPSVETCSVPNTIRPKLELFAQSLERVKSNIAFDPDTLIGPDGFTAEERVWATRRTAEQMLEKMEQGVDCADAAAELGLSIPSDHPMSKWKGTPQTFGKQAAASSVGTSDEIAELEEPSEAEMIAEQLFKKMEQGTDFIDAAAELGVPIPPGHPFRKCKGKPQIPSEPAAAANTSVKTPDKQNAVPIVETLDKPATAPAPAPATTNAISSVETPHKQAAVCIVGAHDEPVELNKPDMTDELFEPDGLRAQFLAQAQYDAETEQRLRLQYAGRPRSKAKPPPLIRALHPRTKEIDHRVLLGSKSTNVALSAQNSVPSPTLDELDATHRKIECFVEFLELQLQQLKSHIKCLESSLRTQQVLDLRLDKLAMEIEKGAREAERSRVELENQQNAFDVKLGTVLEFVKDSFKAIDKQMMESDAGHKATLEKLWHDLDSSIKEQMGKVVEGSEYFSDNFVKMGKLFVSSQELKTLTVDAKLEKLEEENRSLKAEQEELLKRVVALETKKDDALPEASKWCFR